MGLKYTKNVIQVFLSNITYYMVEMILMLQLYTESTIKTQYPTNHIIVDVLNRLRCNERNKLNTDSF